MESGGGRASRPAAAQPRWKQRIHSRAIKPASLDHITQPAVPSSSPLESLSCRYETSWIEEKGTHWPLQRGREGNKRKREGGVGGRRREPDECWQPVRSVIGPVRHPPTSALFVQTFHCSPAAIATETKPSQPRCCCWSRARRVTGAGQERGRWEQGLIRAVEEAHNTFFFFPSLHRLRRSSFLSVDPGKTKASLQHREGGAACGPG